MTKDTAVKNNYANTVAENPFIAFFDIPVKARYQFLLDNAHFIVSTFIKGSVCNGSNAVNSIQEQFYVMFLAPEADNMVISRDFEKKARDLLMLPGVWESDVKIKETISLNSTIVDHREGYRKLRALETKKNRPLGHSMKDLWNGDGENPNALLTVFRHNDNAVVLKGFHGDLPKTLFFLDYALLERLVYNLVVNFDVYGNVSHQTLTRIYMDLIRMEAEEMFLTFLPEKSRLPLRNSWYKGLLTEAKMHYEFPIVDSGLPVNIEYKTSDVKKEFVENVINNYVSSKVLGPLDNINWKHIRSAKSEGNGVNTVLRELASNPAAKALRYSNFFPESAYLIVSKENAIPEIFTIIKNREHENISWILGESLRLSPHENTLNFIPGFYSHYPNQFFEVKEKDIGIFKNKILKIKNLTDYKEFTKEYAISRVSDRFWNTYDLINSSFKRDMPVEFGYLDLTRYLME